MATVAKVIETPAVIKVDGKVKNVTMAACFLRTHTFEDCGEFRRITEFVSLDQCSNNLSPHLFRCHLSQEQIMEEGLILAPPPPRRTQLAFCARLAFAFLCLKFLFSIINFFLPLLIYLHRNTICKRCSSRGQSSRVFYLPKIWH